MAVRNSIGDVLVTRMLLDVKALCGFNGYRFVESKSSA